jgi:hypothetical protein
MAGLRRARPSAPPPVPKALVSIPVVGAVQAVIGTYGHRDELVVEDPRDLEGRSSLRPRPTARRPADPPWGSAAHRAGRRPRPDPTRTGPTGAGSEEDHR